MLAYGEYQLFYGVQFLYSTLTVMYQIECVGYGLLGAGVMLIGAGWTMVRAHRTRASDAESVFVRYRTNWGIGIGTLGYLVTAIGLLVIVVGDAGLLAGFTIIGWPTYYPVSDSLVGIGIAIWAIGAFLDRVSSR